ncbi:putative nuclease HARBI1 [Dendronephthya gigantea]|uniref:putative nuclease HARBI1 n=1 Tax=Dendronephthya gigantea TaxID=151771 RepID=UPI00106C0AAE|nr:putative nuclease HARBI1 [Dendronephthya gigantea]
MINEISPPEDRKKNFRMSKDQFIELCEELRPYISPGTSPNYLALSVEKKVAVTLYYLKDTGTIWMTANTFGIHQCTVSKIVLQVCRAISTHLCPKYIHLPRTEDEMRVKVAEFETKFGMLHAMGCIDGTHVPIRRPNVDSQDYFNYKQFFSVSVQAVCDAKGQLPKTFNNLLPGHNKIPNYVIGDPAYPLAPYCMKEFPSCKSDAEVIFNNMLRSARNPIECAFGRLKARWSILSRKMDLKLTTVPKNVLACFVLHNFCELHHDDIDVELVRNQIARNITDENMHRDFPDPVYSGNTGEGEAIRNTLTEYIQVHLPDKS